MEVTLCMYVYIWMCSMMIRNKKKIEKEMIKYLCRLGIIVLSAIYICVLVYTAPVQIECK